MKVRELIQNRLTGRTIDILSHALNFRAAKHNLISGNLANIDTPGFKPQKLKFDEELRRVVAKDVMPLKTTNRAHFSHFSNARFTGNSRFAIHGRHFSQVEESEKLNLDREMADLAQNNILYEASTRLLAKKLQALRSAIEEGRR
jgi:flagellar basal-body rod protein FlgB